MQQICCFFKKAGNFFLHLEPKKKKKRIDLKEVDSTMLNDKEKDTIHMIIFMIVFFDRFFFIIEQQLSRFILLNLMNILELSIFDNF